MSLAAPVAALSDPQMWIVTLVALGALTILVRRAIGPRRRGRGSGCSSCAPPARER